MFFIKGHEFANDWLADICASASMRLRYIPGYVIEGDWVVDDAWHDLPVRNDLPHDSAGLPWRPAIPHGIVDIKSLPTFKLKLAGYLFWLSYIFSSTSD
jgi:hypothetical protein